MELHEAIRRRAMVRSFSPEPLDPAVVERILLDALRSPTAGNTGGTAWVVLEGPEQTALYFDATTDEAWRRRQQPLGGAAAGAGHPPGLFVRRAYVARYGEPDKADSGLGEGAERWPVPYWTGDAAFGVMAVLLGAVDAGLGACLLGTFRGEDELGRCLGVPGEWRLFCAVALGRPDGRDHRSPSLARTGPRPGERIHRGRWGSDPPARSV